MEVRHLESFLAVSETLHFGHAAERVSLSQSALSRRIQQLERELGVVLFEREGGRVALTVAGEALIIHARRILDEIQIAERALKQTESDLRGHLSIGCFDSASVHVMPGILVALRNRFPNLIVSMTTLGTSEALRTVRQRELDGAIVTLPVSAEGLNVMPLYQEELVVVLPTDHRLATRREITIAMLKSEPLVAFRTGQNTRRLIDQAFEAAGTVPQVVNELESVEAIKAAIRAGLGSSILGVIGLDRRSRGAGLVTRPLVPAIYRSIGLVSRTVRVPNPLLAQFAQVVVQEVHRMVPQTTGQPDHEPAGQRVAIYGTAGRRTVL